MLLIGLTGGIGTGKSVIAALFAELNIPVIKADDVIRELLKPNTPYYQTIVEKLGPSILNNNLTLNKTKLRQLIFNDLNIKIWLEELLHPELYKIMASQIEQLKASYCILEIPLLIEKPPPFTVDRILVVDCSLELQIKRTSIRDNISIHKVKNIISSQVDRNLRLAQNNDIIENNTSLENLQEQVTTLHAKYLLYSQL